MRQHRIPDAIDLKSEPRVFLTCLGRSPNFRILSLLLYLTYTRTIGTLVKRLHLLTQQI